MVRTMSTRATRMHEQMHAIEATMALDDIRQPEVVALPTRMLANTATHRLVVMTDGVDRAPIRLCVLVGCRAMACTKLCVALLVERYG